jgi:hypothetical protein
MTRKKKFAPVRHKFLYRWEDSNGKHHVIEAWARVRHPSRAVPVTVKAAHVERSIKRDGVGDTANCSMAICAVDHADAFPHAVEGHIDWTYTRAFVVSKVGRDGLPKECYVYDHNDEIARMNDSKGGQLKLLKLLQEGGPRTITLTPKRMRSKVGRSGTARGRPGTRDVAARLRGGKLRYAVARVASEQPG